jgi:hypothetical protein
MNLLRDPLSRNVKEKLRVILYEIKFVLNKPTYSNKIFCIGYNKTGTTTVGKAFSMLGYRNTSFNQKIWRKHYNKSSNYYKILRYATKFDSFDDLPWLKEDMITILDGVFPNSKFIYLERDDDKWQESYKRFVFKNSGVYPDLEKGLDSYRKHRKFILKYFEGRQDDFLSISVSDENAFQKIADFLGKKAPQNKLPHYNKT